MYKYSESFTNQLDLFVKSLPFNGALDPENRWIKLAYQIDWLNFELIYAKTFSHTGRPGKDARLVIGALVLKHKLAISDEESASGGLTENPYLQFFVGLKEFRLQPPFDSSTLSNVRKRLGEKEFDEFERFIIKDLQEKKLLKPTGQLVDATVFQSDITFPTDCGLLNRVRKFCVQQIKRLVEVTGTKVRTYCRVAQKAYLAFNKKRKKTAKDVRHLQKAMLQYVRRNLAQLETLVKKAEETGHFIAGKILKQMETAKKIYAQQQYMYTKRLKRVESRIVSFCKPHIRPIVRNKAAAKVEFGPKASISHVDGLLFLDHYSYENFNEGTLLRQNIEKFEKRFGKKPEYVVTDQIYGSRANRELLKENEIRSVIRPLGRKSKDSETNANQRWRRRKQKERNRIEGAFGHTKKHYLLEEVCARTPKTEYSWIRMGLLSHNLVTGYRKS
jgi:hypothetical protein